MKTFWAVILAALFSGCASSPGHFHELALINESSAEVKRDLSLQFDAYIVGIEKDNASRIGRIAECGAGSRTTECVDIDAPYFKERPDLREGLRGKYAGQHRPTYVSHVARFDGTGNVCFLYNIYVSNGLCTETTPVPASPALVSQSWQALSLLGKDIERYVNARNPSHIVVYTMGWNTGQPEALRNIRDLVSQLRAAAGGDAAFRPLVIGLTWPSTGTPLVPASDFGIKAKDADEVGALWENILLNRELRRAKTQGKFRVVVVGHSFGARAATRAVFSAPLVSAPLVGASPPVVDLLVSLQGAYSFQRYLGGDSDSSEGREGAPYRDFATQAGQVVMTASTHDSAVTAALHAPYFVGSHRAFSDARTGPGAERFSHVSTDETGRIDRLVCDSRRVMWIDASSIIKGNQPGTGGGAHSVIYTREAGQLLFDLIKACAP